MLVTISDVFSLALGFYSHEFCKDTVPQLTLTSLRLPSYILPYGNAVSGTGTCAPVFILLYSTLARKWEFELMGFLTKNSLLTIRELMGIRANGDPRPAVLLEK